MTDLLSRLGLELPVLQAGMGGGLATHELAAAVSEAGGLGTIGILDPARLQDELARARSLTWRPIAVNLLLPFTRDRHWAVAREADAVVTFWGEPRRHVPGVWIHQCGSVEEAVAAHAAGADAVIAQGVEAGGHVRGTVPGAALLERVLAALPRGYPVLLAGGIACGGDARSALEAGAAGVVCGTRFLASEECAAHPGYKQRVVSAEETILTELFGLGWPAPHRVIANAATDRWLGGDARGPAAVRLLNRLARPAAARLPLALVDRLAGAQLPAMPLLSPAAPLRDSPARMLDAAPLYAGESVARVREVRPAAELVRELAS